MLPADADAVSGAVAQDHAVWLRGAQTDPGRSERPLSVTRLALCRHKVSPAIGLKFVGIRAAVRLSAGHTTPMCRMQLYAEIKEHVLNYPTCPPLSAQVHRCCAPGAAPHRGMQGCQCSPSLRPKACGPICMLAVRSQPPSHVARRHLTSVQVAPRWLNRLLLLRPGATRVLPSSISRLCACF